MFHFPLFLWILFVTEVKSIRNAQILIPSLVRAGSSTNLHCLFDLEKAPLYSVMWFRGQYEFFRYTPSEVPPGKVFNVAGFYVDIYSSNQHQVTLHNVPTFVSGEVSCEITTDGPSFSTACVSGLLTVRQLDISLKLDKSSYRPGDQLIAECDVSGMDANITFELNKFKVPSDFVVQPVQNKAFLNLTLAREHFLPRRNLRLQCTGTLLKNYQISTRVITVGYDSAVQRIMGNANYLNIAKLLILLQSFLISVL